MKKMVIIFLCIMLVSVSVFAEFVLTPGLGINSHTGKLEMPGLKTSASASITSFTIGLDFAYIMNNGFTFMMNNDLLFTNSAKVTINGNSLTSTINNGFGINSRQLIGYTFKFLNKKLSLRLGSGPSIGFIGGKVEEGNWIPANKLITVGLGFYLGGEYYVKDKVGIAVSITENPAAYTALVTNGGNIFTFKAGVAFKL